MFWPFNTNANNGKTGEQLDAERAQLDRDRAARIAARAESLEEEGDYNAAQELRAEQDEYARQQAENYRREQEALQVTVGDEFAAGIDDGARNVRNAVGDTVKATVGTTFKLLPWWLWLVILGAAALWINGQTGILTMLWNRRRKP